MILIKERIGKQLELLGKLRYRDIHPITEWQMLHLYQKPDQKQLLAEDAAWETMTNREIWGGHREYFCFRVTVNLPESYRGKTVIFELRTGKEGEWDALNPQFLAYVNGKIVQGLDVNHRDLLLTECAEPGECYQIVLSAYTGDNNFSLKMDAEIKCLEREIEHYYYDMKIPYEVARLLPRESEEYIRIIQALNDSWNLVDCRKPFSQAFFVSIRQAQQYLTEEFYQKQCGNSPEVIACVGHTHIDCAWLWTLSVTEDKAVRSFSTVLELMRRYPEYRFMSSQPQLYDYVKKNAPEIFAQIKERVAEGRWEPEGGMWVEADCNISSGESLVRQFLHGLDFFQKEFHRKNEILWLPDVFGYSAALPQIMQKCGIHYFMTTKISWNEFNKMPYDTFEWEGIDGTTVLTHFSSSRDYAAGAVEGGTETEHFTTYNAMLNPSQVKGNWKRYSQKELHTESLMSYGYGDGGGGPTAEMLENCRRMEQGIPGCPRTRQTHTLEFFKKLEQEVAGNRFLPRWVGELYLEYHRGTYTSMARNKRFNRKAEFALQNLEYCRVLAKELLGLPYPQKELDALWQIVLRNQFHDILPGSSIREVYEDSKKEYEALFAQAGRLEREALERLAAAAEGPENSLVIFNPNNSSLPCPVQLPNVGWLTEKAILTTGNRRYAIQKTEEGYLAVVDQVPSKGYQLFSILEEQTLQKEEMKPMIRSLTEIETPYFRIALNEKGQFTRIYDKEFDREVIPAGEAANQIVSYEDKPHNYDAWDINNYYTEKSWEVDEVSELEILENGPVRACIRVKHPYLDSEIVQYLYFYFNIRRIDIRNEIDWREEQILLRDYFPVDIHTNEASFEIQYGNVKRPNHDNTMWDFARFEVCAHKWLDVSEDGYGVSMLNDCKYGCSVRGHRIGLSMLKSALYPNPAADKEHHTFWYAICPHEGDFRKGQIAEMAYQFNNPLYAVWKEKSEKFGKSLPSAYSQIQVQEPYAHIEVVKQAMEGEDLIVRLYEYHNHRGALHLQVPDTIAEAYETNLLEEKERKLDLTDDCITTEITPYEIKTIRLVHKD